MAGDEVGTLARLKACRVIIDELIAGPRRADAMTPAPITGCSAAHAALARDGCVDPSGPASAARGGLELGSLSAVISGGCSISSRPEAAGAPDALPITSKKERDCRRC